MLGNWLEANGGIMGNKFKARGTAAETALVNYLRGRGQTAVERRALTGANDKGDVAWLPWLAVEVKNARTPRYGEWLREAEAERSNSDAEIGVVVHKPHGTGITSQDNWHVVMTMSTFMSLLDRGGWL